MHVKEAKAATIAWLSERGAGKRTVNYKLRDWLFSRQRYWGEPFPVIHMEDGSIRLVDEEGSSGHPAPAGRLQTRRNRRIPARESGGVA